MFTWEFPPLIAGGLGMACYGICKALLKAGIEIDLVLPTKEFVYFPFRTVEDVDKLPVVFLDSKKQKEFITRTFETKSEEFEYIGMTEFPESYINGLQLKSYQTILKKAKTTRKYQTVSEERVWEDLRYYLIGEEDIFRKVQEMTARAERYSQELRFDIIHAHDWLCYPAGMVVKKLSGKPLVSHIHATEFDRGGSNAGDYRIHNIEFDGMTYADKVIAVSKYTANMITSRYQIDTGKISIVHNAYEMEDDTELRRKRLFSGMTILFLGRITLQKGPDYFLQVADRIIRKYPKVRFIMAGTGDMARKLTHDSASKRLRNQFLFAGFLNRPQVSSILNSVDIYMLPSVSEPFGIAPLEAMAYGVTAIISKQSGVSEVVKNAYKVDFWDIDAMCEILEHLIENPAACAQMGLAGKEEVIRIAWDKAAEKIIKVYESLL